MENKGSCQRKEKNIPFAFGKEKNFLFARKLKQERKPIAQYILYRQDQLLIYDNSRDTVHLTRLMITTFVLLTYLKRKL